MENQQDATNQSDSQIKVFQKLCSGCKNLRGAVKQYFKRHCAFDHWTLGGYIFFLVVDLCCLFQTFCSPIPDFLSYQRDNFPDTLIGLSINWLSMFAVIQIILSDATKHHNTQHKSTVALSFVVVCIPLLSIILYAKKLDTWLSFFTFAQVLTVIYLFTRFVHQKSSDIDLNNATEDYKKKCCDLKTHQEVFDQNDNEEFYRTAISIDLEPGGKRTDERGAWKASLEKPQLKRFLSVLFNYSSSSNLPQNFHSYVRALLVEIIANKKPPFDSLITFEACLTEESTLYQSACISVWHLLAKAVESANSESHDRIQYICGIIDESSDTGSKTASCRENLILKISHNEIINNTDFSKYFTSEVDEKKETQLFLKNKILELANLLRDAQKSYNNNKPKKNPPVAKGSAAEEPKDTINSIRDAIREKFPI